MSFLETAVLQKSKEMRKNGGECKQQKKEKIREQNFFLKETSACNTLSQQFLDNLRTMPEKKFRCNKISIEKILMI